MSLFIGIDAGGTKTALRAEGADETTTLTGPGVNLRRDGLDRTAEVLADLLRQALGAGEPGRLAGLCAGVAGAGDGHADLQARLQKQLALNAPLLVTHDADLALEAAFGTGSGLIVVAGTGSVALGRTRATEDDPVERVQAGGWGYRLGDDGGGTALGRAALRAAAAALDGGPPTALTELLAETHGLDTRTALLDWTYAHDGVLADLAPLLLTAAEADDWVASSTLIRETNALAGQAGWLATRLQGRIETRAAILGGLTHEPVYRDALLGALGRHLPGWTATACETEPVVAAVGLARRLTATPA